MELLNPTSFDVIALLAGLASFAGLCWMRPLWGVYATAALLPTYLIRPTIAGLPTTVLELCILILFAVWLLKDRTWRRLRLPWSRATSYNPVPRSFSIPLSLLLIGAFIGMLVSENNVAAFGIFKAYFLEPAMFLIVLVYELKQRHEMRTLMYILGCLVIGIGIIAAWQMDTGLGIHNPFWQATATRRVTTLFGYPNASALLVAPLVGWFIGWFIKTKDGFERLFAAAVIVAGLITIVAAKSTGALIGVGVSCLVALWFFNKKMAGAAMGIAALLLLGFIIINTGGITTLYENVAANHLDLSSTSLEIRINQWRETLSLLADSPLTGAGLAGYQQALVPYHQYRFLEIYLYPHNILLNFWVEIGLIGLIGAAWLIMVCVKKLLAVLRDSQGSNAYALALVCAWTTLLIHGLVDVPYFKNDLSVLWMLLVGLSITTTQNRLQK